MTWSMFQQRVNELLAEGMIPPETPISSINWDALAFGGPIPDVYINNLTEGLVIVED